jgi:hypothetical protein
MTQTISSTSVTSFATELAELMIQNETTQSDADRAARDADRATFLRDSQHQVDELHSAASAMENGALVGAAFSIAGDACAIGAASYQYDAATTDPCDKGTIASDTTNASYLQDSSKLFAELAGPAKTLVGDVPQKNDEANAKQFETLAEQAKWQADDASTDLNKVDKLGDKILDIVQSLNQALDSATNAVIGRI